MKSHPTKQFQTLVPQLREKGFYLSQKERKISWSIYNLNQINDLKESLTFIREEVDNCNILSYNRAGRPLTNVKSLAKAILFCELFQIPERQAQGYLENIVATGVFFLLTEFCAQAEETEMVVKHGQVYADYMDRSSRWLPIRK